MKKFIIIRSIFRIIGSIGAFVAGGMFIASGVQDDQTIGYIFGGICILLGILAIINSLTLLLKIKD